MNNYAIITDEGEMISYNIIPKIISEFTAKLIPRSLMGIITSNSLGSLIGYISCLYEKHVPIMLKENTSYESLKKYIDEYHMNYIWVPSKWMEEKKEIFFIKKRIVLEKYKYILLEISNISVQMNDELALLLSTSGTTGGVKLVRQSYQNILSNTKAITRYLDIVSTDVAITSLPMNYTYGLSVINTHLFSKATILVTKNKIYTKKFWDFFSKYKATTISGVPYMYEMMRKLGIINGNIPTLKTFTVAGGKMLNCDEEYYINYSLKYRKKFFVMYGQTEATARISYRPFENVKKKIGSVGIAIPNGKIWIEDSDGNKIILPNIDGEVVYSGNNVMLGYAEKKSDLCKSDEMNGILHTGDIGYLDSDGYCYIVSRNDRNIKLNGLRIDLDDVDDTLRKKFLLYCFKSNCEKCLDAHIEKRICIDVSSNDNISIKEEDIKLFTDFISKEFSLNRKLFCFQIVKKQEENKL